MQKPLLELQVRLWVLLLAGKSHTAHRLVAHALGAGLWCPPCRRSWKPREAASQARPRSCRAGCSGGRRWRRRGRCWNSCRTRRTSCLKWTSCSGRSGPRGKVRSKALQTLPGRLFARGQASASDVPSLAHLAAMPRYAACASAATTTISHLPLLVTCCSPPLSPAPPGCSGRRVA